MFEKEYAKKVLEEFLSLPLENSSDVLEKFAALPNAIYHNDGGKLSFVYVPGNRDDRVVLAAHADTVWDKYYNVYPCAEQKLQDKNGTYSGTNGICGIGADDRAGCAILWLLKDFGHSLLILDGEENGQMGAKHLRDSYPKLFDEINDHSYIVQFDRRNANDYKCYRLPVTEEFKKFIEKETNYKDAGKTAFTDIVTLCTKICGVNLSVGYYDEHSSNEMIVFDEWYHTLDVAYNMLTKEQKKYPLDI